MRPTDELLAAQKDHFGHKQSSHENSPTVSFALLVLFSLGLVAVAYPLVAVGLLLVGVTGIVLLRRLVRYVARHRGSVRRATLPGLGTVEYRFTRS